MRKLSLVFLIIPIIMTTACSSSEQSRDFTYLNYFKQTHSYEEYLKIKEKISGFDKYYTYSDGIMWVRKDNKDFDVNEELYGAINMNGDLVVPLNSTWTSVHDFSEGIAFVHFKAEEKRGDNTAIIDTNGNIIKTFNVNRNYKDMHNSFSEGYAIYEKDFGANKGSRCYIIDKVGNTKQITPRISFSNDGEQISNFKEGLCRVYADVMPEAIGKGSCTFINTDGEIQFSMQKYWVKNSSDFENGQAKLTIRGEDKKDYTVIIDKNGNILSTEKK